MRLELIKAAELYRQGDYEASADMFFNVLLDGRVLVDVENERDFELTIEEALDDNDLGSSSEYRGKGLMSPNYRRGEFSRLVKELRMPGDNRPPASEELDGMQDLCHHLYAGDVADMMAHRLGVTRQQVREALDAALKWVFKT